MFSLSFSSTRSVSQSLYGFSFIFDFCHHKSAAIDDDELAFSRRRFREANATSAPLPQAAAAAAATTTTQLQLHRPAFRSLTRSLGSFALPLAPSAHSSGNNDRLLFRSLDKPAGRPSNSSSDLQSLSLSLLREEI